MGHSARQNDSFWKVKWAVLKCKMGHFASVKNVKKIQVLCFQCFRKLSKFAYLRPQDFNFRIIESQSTFFDFLSKEFRTFSTAYGPLQKPLTTSMTAAFLFSPSPLLHPLENMPISIINKFLSAIFRRTHDIIRWYCVRFALSLNKIGCISTIKTKKRCFFVLYCVRFALSLHRGIEEINEWNYISLG